MTSCWNAATKEETNSFTLSRTLSIPHLVLPPATLPRIRFPRCVGISIGGRPVVENGGVLLVEGVELELSFGESGAFGGVLGHLGVDEHSLLLDIFFVVLFESFFRHPFVPPGVAVALTTSHSAENDGGRVVRLFPPFVVNKVVGTNLARTVARRVPIFRLDHLHSESAARAATRSILTYFRFVHQRSMETQHALSLRKRQPVHGASVTASRPSPRKLTFWLETRTRNIEIPFNFRPVCAASARRAMVSKRPQERGLPAFTTNLASSPSSLALSLSTVHPVWIAGESVEGTLEVSVLKENVWLGEIALEFTAFEGQSSVAFYTTFHHPPAYRLQHHSTDFHGVIELKSQDHTSSRRLFSTEIKFQGPSLPPSNAILPSYTTSLPGGPGDFLPARKGRTRFPFTFELPLTTASSASIYNNARRFYELRAIGTSRFDGEVSFVSKKLVVDVVEDWWDWEEPEFQGVVERTKGELVWKGGAERIELEARIVGGRLFWRRDAEEGKEGNGNMEVLVTVANRTTKGVSLTYSLTSAPLTLFNVDLRLETLPPSTTDHSSTSFHRSPDSRAAHHHRSDPRRLIPRPCV